MPNFSCFNTAVSESTITANTNAPATFCLSKMDRTRPHVCGTCQRSFARLEHLQRHERCHTKEKPFECPECSRCFARRDLLLRHRKKLHHTSTTSSHAGIRLDSASGVSSVASGQNRTRKLSVAGLNPTASNTPAIYIKPRANTITHVDGNTMQMISAANTSVTRGMPPTHTHSLVFGPGSTIDPNALPYNHLSQSMALQEALPFMPSRNEMTLNQTDDDSYEWLRGFKHQISFYTNENVMDRSSPSAISMTSQSGISDVMLDGLNDPAPAGTNTIWQSPLIGPPQMPNLLR
ncbi:Respiration factor 2 [Fusarium oxysporum f. sp. raphani]|uniref:Respiration factor 2 n=1 Tax=Fusarium oxysporum f. sp. raphani TaxID=96318 RepID=A0A8J5NI92_FUSOX|nr:Respiration factor 2 [Fusarium oxysporum f. sp. raphani]